MYLYRSRRGCSTVPLQILEIPRHQGGCADLFFVYCESLSLVTVWLRFLGWHALDGHWRIRRPSKPGKYLIGYIELIRQKFLNFSMHKNTNIILITKILYIIFLRKIYSVSMKTINRVQISCWKTCQKISLYVLWIISLACCSRRRNDKNIIRMSRNNAHAHKSFLFCEYLIGYSFKIYSIVNKYRSG